MEDPHVQDAERHAQPEPSEQEAQEHGSRPSILDQKKVGGRSAAKSFGFSAARKASPKKVAFMRAASSAAADRAGRARLDRASGYGSPAARGVGPSIAPMIHRIGKMMPTKNRT